MSSSEPNPRWTSRLTRTHAIHLAVVLLCTIAAVGHQVSLWNWFIEDAAISFAYAKHFAEGDGFVSWVGGERVEGYSNPTWTFFLAALHWGGFDLFVAVKWVQVVQTALTVPVTYLIGREAFCDRPDNPAVLLVPCFVAANAQFAIWGSAGLENGMLNLFIALAMWRMLVEARTGRFPWSAVLWLLVSLTRPESITYAAVGGFLSMVFHLGAGRGLKPTVQWLLLFWPPFLAYHYVRYQYFAWPFPNTYYAKLDHRDAPPGMWGKRPWVWSQKWAHELGHGYLMPLYLFGGLGHGKAWRYLVVAFLLVTVGGAIEMADDQRWLLPVILGSTYIFFAVGLTWGNDAPPRRLVGGGLVAAIALFALSEALRHFAGFEPNALPKPDSIATITPYLLVGGGLLVPLLAVGSPGWHARTTAWSLCVAAAFFAVWAEFDWMKGYRWYATAAVPGAVLLALGVDSMVLALNDWTQVARIRMARVGAYGWAVLVVAGFATIHGFHTASIVDKPDPRPQGVRTRVTFVDGVRKQLYVDEERWLDLDVDMGAHLYWSDFEMLDIAGLADVPFGHNKFDRGFVREYLFQEKRPHFAHVHGSWANTSKIPSHPEWKRDYVEIPGFPVGGNQFHIGNHVRKDLFLIDDSPFPVEQRRVGPKGVVFEGFAVPVKPGKARAMYVEVGVRKQLRSKAGNMRLLMALKGAGGEGTVELALGYDWYMPADWTPGKMFHGRYGAMLPPSLQPGTYDVAFVLLDEDGSVLPLADIRGGAADERPPLYATGEARYDSAVTIVTPEERSEIASDRREAAIVAANEGRCDEAKETWYLSRRSRPMDWSWLEEHTPRVHEALAACFVAQVAETEDLEAKLALLETVRFYDARNADVWTVGAEVAAPLLEAGRRALDEGREACAAVAPGTQGLLARFTATAEDYQALGACQKEHEDQWDTAYGLLRDAMRADPTLAWGRRWAEEARALRFGLDPASQAVKDAEVEERRRSVEKRKKEYEARKKAQKGEAAAQDEQDEQDDGEEGDAPDEEEPGGDGPDEE